MSSRSFLVHVFAAVVVIGMGACRREAPAGPPRASGYVEATDVRVAAKVPGRVEGVNVVEGARVNAGDTLVTLSTTDVGQFVNTQLAALSILQLAALSATNISALDATQTAALSTTQIKGLTTTQLKGLSSTDVADLADTQIAALTTSQLGALSTGVINTLTTTQIGQLQATQLSGLTATQLDYLSTTNIEQMSSTQANALTATQVQSLSDEQVASTMHFGGDAKRRAGDLQLSTFLVGWAQHDPIHVADMLRALPERANDAELRSWLDNPFVAGYQSIMNRAGV